MKDDEDEEEVSSIEAFWRAQSAFIVDGYVQAWMEGAVRAG
jgi:hypothetical protein